MLVTNINWSKYARVDLRNFRQYSSKTPSNLEKYIVKLVNYADTLVFMKRLGKRLIYFQKIEVRQIIYKEHRVIYHLKKDIVTIITIVHTKRDLDKIFKTLNV